MMDPLIIIESKEIIKKNMDDCMNVINNPENLQFLNLAQAIYNTNALLDALIEGIIHDQLGQ